MLSVDGGGLRGVFSAAVIQRMEAVTGKPARELFGAMAGTSTGSLIVASLAQGLSAGQIRALYVVVGSVLFQGGSEDAMQAAAGELVAMLGEARIAPGTPKRQPLSEDASPAERRSAGFEALLQLLFAERTLADLQVPVCIPVLDTQQGTVEFLDNFAPGGEPETPIWQAVRRSTALPPLFTPVDDRYLDGGISAFANPTFGAYEHVAHALDWKRNPKWLQVHSVGTTYRPPMLAGLGIERGLRERYGPLYPEPHTGDAAQDPLHQAEWHEQLMAQYMIDAIMQDINYVQHQRMKDQCAAGHLWYKRYNEALRQPFADRYGAELAKRGIAVTTRDDRIALYELRQGPDSVAALGTVGELVGADRVKAEDFG